MSDINTATMLQVGTVLHGTYRIESYLSSGGFGNTYIAKNIEFGETHAIKEFFVKGVCQRDGNSTTISVSNTENSDSFAQQKEKFKKEARRLRSLSNPHVVKVYDLFEENGTAYYVMDYVDGENLSTRLNRTHSPLAESEVRNYLSQILDGLEAIHAAGIWHLDIKPANIMVDSHNVVKLIDFGASKQQSTAGGATMSTGISYTNGYAPSEQMAQSYDKFGPWTDFYALGATLYKLLTNQNPPSVTDLSEDESEDKHIALPMPNVSNEMKNLVVWMMQVNRLKRPKNVGEIRNLIKNGIGSMASNDATPNKFSNVMNSDKEETILLDNKVNEQPEMSEQSKGQEEKKSKGSSSSDARFCVIFLLVLIVACGIAFFSRGCGNSASSDSTNFVASDSDTAMIDTGAYEQDGIDSAAAYDENKMETFFGEEVTFTGSELASPDPGSFYPVDNGKMVFSDGRVYEGPFNRGRMEGDNATFTYPNGDTFVGSFYDNHFSKGTYTVKQTGEQFIGTFNGNGQPKQGAWYDENGNFLQNV